jgi:hypothetical protein
MDMTTSDGRTPEQIRLDIEAERERLAGAVDNLRDGMDINKQLKGKVPIAAAAALGVGFIAAGGIGATMRLVMRKGREGHTKARVGPFFLIDRD